jgi:DNA-binding LytR/AlgR family response regulator
MKVLIIEDEPQAAQHIERLLQRIDADIEVLAKLDSVKSAVKWFTHNESPDLAFMDIQLGDGLSFDIFDKTAVGCSVVFTTAYDEFALKAFKVNSIDYLLKPIDMDEFKAALDKFKSLKFKEDDTQKLLSQIDEVVRSISHKKFKNRFLIRIGEKLKSLTIDEILYFYSFEKASFCHATDGRNYLLDYSLEQLEDMVNPELYFRINRKYLVKSSAILDMINYTNSRLKLKLKGSDDNEVIVARERVQDFKDWMNC